MQAAVVQYERKMTPAEQKIASKLAQQLNTLKVYIVQLSFNRSPVQSNPHQMMREFLRFKDLIRRPNISKQLISERELLLSQLAVHVKQTKEDFAVCLFFPLWRISHFVQKRSNIGVTGGNTGIPMGKNMPDIVAQIVWVRQILSKLDETCQTVTSLLGDLAGTNKFMEETLDFLEELKSSEKERVCLYMVTWLRASLPLVPSVDAGGARCSGRHH